MVEVPGGLAGIDAVVDKDYVAALVATEMKADLLVLLTDVAGVMTDYGTPKEQLVREVGTDALGTMSFAAGSMGPKVAAARRFVQDTGQRAAIGALGAAEAVIAGSAGTQIHRTVRGW